MHMYIYVNVCVIHNTYYCYVLNLTSSNLNTVFKRSNLYGQVMKITH